MSFSTQITQMIKMNADFFCSFFSGYSQRPPALQSVWFIPHVAVYMFAYLVITCAFMLAVRELIVLCYRKEHKRFAKNTKIEHSNTNLRVNKIEILCNQFIKIGTIAMGIGICLGAIWAKKAWGQYWSWDIKETAALITWFIFLLYLHLQKLTKINRKYLLIIVIIGFMSLLFTWFGVNYLPSAQKSPHTFYTAQNSTVYSTKQELSLLFEREKL